MKIAIDHQAFTHQAYGGVSRYVVRLSEHLLKTEEVLIFAPIHQNRYVDELPREVVRGVRLNSYPPNTTRLFFELNRLFSIYPIRRWKPDIIHETYYAARASGLKKLPRVLTVYDMIHELYPDQFSKRDRTSELKKRAVLRADKIICISESTKNDLMKCFGTPEGKITVVHLGFEKTELKPSAVPRQDSRPYLLYVGNRGGYKNFKGLIKAIAASNKLKNDFDVVAFGGEKFDREELDFIVACGLRTEQVKHCEGNDQTLGLLYRQARAFVYPSLYEGFGLPPIEAMAHDCPVVSSNTSSMPEVIGSAANFFVPSDIESIKEAIERTVYSEQSLKNLVKLGSQRLHRFSWEKCATETLKVYKATVEAL